MKSAHGGNDKAYKADTGPLCTTKLMAVAKAGVKNPNQLESPVPLTVYPVIMALRV